MNNCLNFKDWLSKQPFPIQSHEDIIDKYYKDLIYLLEKNKLELNVDKQEFLKYFQYFIYSHSDIHIRYNEYYYENHLKEKGEI